MNRSISQLRSRKFHAGITVLEVLIALGLLVVLLSFAAPSLSGATARAELKAAMENVDLNIRMARNTARQMNTDVIMHLENSHSARHHSISYFVPARQTDIAEVTTLMDYQFPESVRIVASETDIRFDSRGLVEPPVQLRLISLLDDDVNERILVE
jgi:Tfp pilus assembly protein FimT